jgi:hypothetical protein
LRETVVGGFKTCAQRKVSDLLDGPLPESVKVRRFFPRGKIAEQISEREICEHV